MQNAKCKMQNRRCGARAEVACKLCRAARRKSLRSRVNAKCKIVLFTISQNLKSSIMRLFLCKARRQIRSIAGLCEHFDIRRLVQNTPTSQHAPKIGDYEIIFVRSKGAKAEHTLAYVSISLSADSCKKNS